MKYKAIPEWEKPKSVFFVYPEQLPRLRYKIGRFQLAELYDDLIRTMPDYIQINIIIKSKTIEEKFDYSYPKMKMIYLPSVQDIWIRDWAPILAKDESGNTTGIKFNYSPAYLTKSEPKDDNTGKLLIQYLKMPFAEVSLVLDGGNFAYNGNGIGIVTNRVVSDNENLSIKEIKDIFKQNLGIEQLIFIPVEPGDETGHTDGSVRFINENTLLVGAYPETYRNSENLIPPNEFKESKEHMDRLAEFLQSELGNDFKIITVTNAIPRNPEKKDGFSSAFGNYINYLRVGKEIYLPQYGIPEDLDALILFQNNFKGLEIIPVDSKEIKKLSYEGGVLNCISWITY
jgi:agmatine deiminase